MGGVRSFEFATSGRVVFGRDSVRRELGAWAKKLGRHPPPSSSTPPPPALPKAVVITGKEGLDRPSYSGAVDSLKDAGLEYAVFRLFEGSGNNQGQEEPTVAMAEAAVSFAKKEGADVIIGIGGGSAVDTGKAVAALVTQPGTILDYMEVVGKGQPLTAPPLPFIAVPTTAGTGSEVTKNSVFDDPEKNVKASLRDNSMLPTVAIIDPLLTLSVPAAVTAATGLDALTQNLEPYVCNATNPITDALTLEGLRRAARSLVRCYRDGADVDAREDMCVASLFGGLSLANAKLGVVHGFAGPLGGMIHGPHGALCAAMLPAAVRVNVEALKRRGGEESKFYLNRFETVAKVLTGDESAKAEDGVKWIAEVVKELQVPGLSAYGMTRDRFAEAIEKGSRSSSMKGNPVQLDESELIDVLESSM